MLLAALAVGTSACNGGSDVPAGAVAVVDGTPVPQSALDELINRQKAVYASHNQEFPTEGSESYENIQRNYVVYLVQQAEFQQEAKKLGVVVSQQDVDDALVAFIKSDYNGNRTKFQRSLKAQGFTLATFKESLRASVLTRKVLAAANRNVTVNDRDLVAYYKLNRATKYAEHSLQTGQGFDLRDSPQPEARRSQRRLDPEPLDPLRGQGGLRKRLRAARILSSARLAR